MRKGLLLIMVLATLVLSGGASAVAPPVIEEGGGRTCSYSNLGEWVYVGQVFYAGRTYSVYITCHYDASTGNLEWLQYYV